MSTDPQSTDPQSNDPQSAGGMSIDRTPIDRTSPGPMFRRPRKYRRLILTSALATGTMFGTAGIAAAATSSTSGTNSTSSSSTTNPTGSAPTGKPPTGTPPTGNPATLAHGPGETLLTGTQLAKATAAAEAAVPGATVIRAETDSSGDYPYEVHLKKSDGTYVTVELDSTFTVVKTVTGFGPPPAGTKAPSGTPPTGSGSGGKPPTGAPPAGAPSSSASAEAA